MAIAYKPHEKQKLAHQAILTEGYKRAVLLFGRQSGKTYFAVNHTWISAVIKQGRYFIVFSTYKQAHDVVWRQYVNLIPKELIAKTNEQNLSIELNPVEGPVKMPNGQVIHVTHDPTKPPSTIQLLGSDQADSHRGFKADGIVFDEYGDQNGDNFKLVYEPMLSTTNGWAVFLGTPRGYNHFYDLIQYAKDSDRWFYLEATWRDSPYVDREFMELTRKEAEQRGQLSGFMQEYELEFRSVQGAVYPVFNRNVHIIKPSDIPEELTYYGAIDFGFHTTAFLLFGVDKDQTWYVIDEVYGRQETLDNLIPRIKNVIGDKRIVMMVADSANRDAIEVMGRDFPVVGVNKANDSKGYELGIGLVTEKLKPRQQLVGPPKPSLFVASNCKNFVYEMESYKFPEEKENRNPSDIPVKKDDHGCFTYDTIVNGRPIGEFGQFMGEQKVWEWQLGNTKIKATPDHPVLTNRGFVRMDTLRYTDVICKDNLFMTVSSGTGVKPALSGLIGCTISAQKRQIQALVRDCTDIYGEKQTVKSLLGITFTTLMATLKIMTLPTFYALVLVNTLLFILKTKLARIGAKRTSITPLKGHQNGQKLQKARKDEVKSASKMPSFSHGIKLKEIVTSVKNRTFQKTPEEDSAIKTVKPLRYVGVAKTYNLRTRSGTYTANGIRVSNCDAIRYLFLHLKHGIHKEEKVPTPSIIKSSNEYGLL